MAESKDRAQRLAAALRDNLRKRKAQSRDARAGEGEPLVPDDPTRAEPTG